MKKILLACGLVMCLGLSAPMEAAVVITGTVNASTYVGTTDTLEFQNGTMKNTTDGVTLSNDMNIASGYTGTFDLQNRLNTTGTITVSGTFSGGGADLCPTKLVFNEGSTLNVDAGTVFTARIEGGNRISGEITKTGGGTFQIGSNGNNGITKLILKGGTYNGFASNRITGAVVTLDGGTYAWGGLFDGSTLSNDFVIETNGGTLNTNDFNVTMSGTITGSGDFARTGKGMLQLTKTGALDSFSGTFTLKEGTTYINGSGIGAGFTAKAGVSVASGAVLWGSGNIWTKSLVLAEGSEVNVSSGGELYLRSSVQDFLSGTLTKTGEGTLAVGSANTTKLDRLILKEGVLDNHGDGKRIGLAAITFDGGTYRWRGTHSLENEMDVTSNGGTLDTYTNGTTAVSVSGNITGEGILTKKGETPLTLSGTASDFGGLDIQEGKVNLTNTSPLAASGKTFTVTGIGELDVASKTEWLGTLDVTGVTVNFSVGRLLSNESGAVKMGNISVTDGAMTFTATNAFGSGTVLPTLLTLTRSTLQNKVTSGSLWANLPNMVLNDSTILSGTAVDSSRIFADGKITATGTSAINEKLLYFRSDAHAYSVDGKPQSGLVEVTEGSTLTISSQVLPQSGNIPLVKSGKGTLVLTSTSDNGVSLVVNDGVLELRSTLGASLGTSLTVNADSTLYVATPNQKVSGVLTVNDSGTLWFDLDAFHSADYVEGVSLLTPGSVGSLKNENFLFEVDDIDRDMYIEFASDDLVAGYTGMTADYLASILAAEYNVNGIPYMMVSELAGGAFAITYNTAGLPEPGTVWLLLLSLTLLRIFKKR